MDVKEAARLAKTYVTDLFADEGVSNVGLEEIELKCDQVWEVTVGFSRPWEQGTLATITLGQKVLRRSYKVLRIDSQNGNIASVKDRILRDA